ncbi:MAG: hypothetical protein E7594_02605 [Ruminococcaceae bacterium]|nr:hypothetical protein [Oscillospiraceae bacterium]
MSSDYRAYALPSAHDFTETIHQNLLEIADRQQPLHLARAFHFGELVGELSLSQIPDRDTLLTLYERLFPENRQADPYTIAMRHADLITMCTEIATVYPNAYDALFTDLFGRDTHPASDAEGRVAYVQNSYTEQAFMELTGFIKHRRVAYFHHFDDVCQEVRGGRCEYGILPVESAAEGLLAGLFRLIELHDLRICALCRVPGTNDGYTAFALVRKSLIPVRPQEAYCLDFLCTPANEGEIGEVIGIAALCGHSVLHTATYKGQDSDTFRLRLAISPDTLYPFLIYLSLFCADITPIGFYLIK